MKLTINVLLGLLWLVFSSCSDWLNVNPQTEIKETELFKDEAGFKSALTGVYIQMAEEELYGKNMSFYLPELLAHHWYYPSTNTDPLYRLSTYDFESYEEDKTIFKDVWINYYKLIAQLNNILSFIDQTDVFFEAGNDKIVKGEALGLRAFLHFELFRLFAPHPDGNNLQEKRIPYMEVLTHDVNELLSIEGSKVIEYIERDLNAAEELLRAADPILNYTNSQLNSFKGATRPEDDWQMCRQSRFNYYAVLATKARFYHWIGKTGEAVSYAKKVIESGKFVLGNADSYSEDEGSLVLLEENIFNVVNLDHQDIVKGMFIEQYHTLKQTSVNMESAFERTINPNDIRGVNNRYWVASPDEGYVSYLKYYGNEQASIKAANTIPLIRMAELYLILLELEPLDVAMDYFYDYRVARNLSTSLDNDFKEESTRKERVEKEYRKEFFGEGQMFYFYKRLHYTSFTWPENYNLPSLDSYTLPKPEGQLNYEFD